MSVVITSKNAATRSKVGGCYANRGADFCRRGHAMSVKFFDLQDDENPDNGSPVTDGPGVRVLLTRNVRRPPITCKLVHEQQTELLIGLGASLCFVQHSSTDGSSPYLVAYLESERKKTGVAEFLITNSPTEIQLSQCIPLSILLEVAAYYVETGERSPAVLWEEA